jgi:hypothetical protein
MSRWRGTQEGQHPLVHERYFFEIAIYRISHNRFNEGCERDLRRRWEQFTRLSGRTREQVSEELRLNVAQHFWETYGGPWQFNQAVAWLRLFVLGSQIQADLWMSPAKRLQRTAQSVVPDGGRASRIYSPRTARQSVPLTSHWMIDPFDFSPIVITL